MNKALIGVSLLTAAILLSACSNNNSAYSILTSPGTSYDRSKVCANLTQQIGFLNDQGYNATNQGPGQVQQQQLLAAYKANGCDK